MRTRNDGGGRDLRVLLVILAGSLVMACTQDAESEIGGDAGPAGGSGGAPVAGAGGGEGDAVVGGNPGGATADAGAPDSGGPGGNVPPDQGLPPDAGDPCSRACDVFTDCAVTECDGYTEADADDLRASCADLCAGNPAFATVVNGSAGCEDVVTFARDQAGDAFAAACAPPEEPPPEPDGSECRIPCSEAEVCQMGHCVRLDGTCEGHIHCRTGIERCLDGQCVPEEFAECRGDDDCHGDQLCLIDPGNPLAGGSCLYDCTMGQECPFNERCYPEYAGGSCYYELCGPQTGNGQILGTCEIGAGPGAFEGTCFPLPASSGENLGICLEAGRSEEGEACDLQVEGRDDAARELECAPGTYCWGDFDDGELPADQWRQLGTCAKLCDPNAPDCSPGRECVDFSNGDDPQTPEDDSRTLGICLVLECDLLAEAPAPPPPPPLPPDAGMPAPDADAGVPDAGMPVPDAAVPPADAGAPPAGCGQGEACRLVSLNTRRGECGPAGQAGRFEPCQTSDDCAGVAFCGDAGLEQLVCMPHCDPAAAIGDVNACAEGEVCYATPGWLVGFCVPQPPTP